MKKIRFSDLFGNHVFTVGVSIVILFASWLWGYDDFFFWDTVQLSSKQAHFFYEQEAFSLLLPEQIDSGHFPFMGMYLSVWWKLLGKSLFVSHLAMVPWVIVLAFAVSSIVALYIPVPYRLLSVMIILADPTLLTQLRLVSPDVILMAALSVAMVSYLKKQAYGLAVSILILSLISLRGLLVTAALMTAIIFWRVFRKEKESVYTYIVIFAPAVLVNVAFLFYHYISKDWVGFHADSPWSPSFQMVTIKGFIKNTVLFGWRMVDFGRAGIVSCTVVFFLKNPKQRIQKAGWPGLLFLITFTVLFLVTTGYQSLTAHRYYLPLYFLLSLLFCIFLFHSSVSGKIKTTLSFVVLTLLISGHFWIYPAGVAQGWDSSFAHRPIFDLFPKAEHFLGQQNIPKENVGTFFPFTAEEKHIFLRESTSAFAYAAETKTPYLFLSNVMNDIPDSWLKIYTPDKALFYEKKGGVWVGIFRRL